MSGWFGGGGKTNSGAITKYTGLSIQTSALGVPVPLVWGKKRLGTNLIWYGDFVAKQDGKKGGGKGGDGKGGAIYDYSVAVLLALCEGPISSVGTVWADREVTTLAKLGLTLFTGTASQAPWSYLVSAHPSQALSYAYTAYLANSSYALGKSPNLPNHSFEIVTPLSGSMPGSVDVNMADVVSDFLTNPQYSLNFPSSGIDSASLAIYKTYCRAQNLFFSPDLTSNEQVSQILDRWAQITNTWIFWTGAALKFIPLGDSAINNGDTFSAVIQTAIPQTPGPYTITGVPTVTADGGVTYQTGGALTSVGGAPGVGQYHYSAGVWTFNATEAGTAVIIKYTYAYNGPSYTPVTTPIYNLTFEDFVSDQGVPPITVTRSDPADAPNHVKLEIKDRSNAYNAAVSEWKDQGLVTQYGMIDSPNTQAHEVCDVNIGQIVAQLIGQAGAYIRNKYEFRLGWEFCLLEPGDIVTLTDAHIGITEFPVRIRTLDEDESGNWSIVADEFPGGVGTALGTQVPQGVANTTVSMGVSPGEVNPPAIFEPNATLQNTGGIASLAINPQLWIAASGGPNWGGCVVYVSFDAVNYSPIGSISNAAPQGVLTATLADHADPDTVNTLSIDTTESNVVVPTDATTADADAFRTLCLLTPSFTTAIPNNGEAIAYGSAVSTGAFTADLTYMRRGLYGTAHAAHASGQYFTRFNLNHSLQPGNTFLVYQLPVGYIGQTLHFKFASFNKFGNAPEDISTVTAYTYTPTGVSYGGGAGGVPTTPTGLTATAGIGQNVLTWTVNPASDNVDYYNVYAAPGLSQPFGSATLVGTSSSPNFTHGGLVASSQWTYFLKAHNAVGLSAATSGVNATTTGTLPNLFRLSGNLAGQPTDAQVLFEVEMVGGEGLPSGLSSSVGGCDVAPTNSVTFPLLKNGSSVGTMNIASGATTATFTFSGSVSFSSADLLTFKAPSPADPTLSGPHYTFIGTR